VLSCLREVKRSRHDYACFDSGMRCRASITASATFGCLVLRTVITRRWTGCIPAQRKALNDAEPATCLLRAVLSIELVCIMPCDELGCDAL
jgi:hypothetical protein